MKEVIGKYAFEVIVIFIGITASFLFEEWRQNQEEDEKAIEIMKSMVIELERNNQFIMDADTFYHELGTNIQKFLYGDKISRDETIEISYSLMENVSNYRLKSISSFIHGFSSTDHLNILNRNKKILQYLSYMESLLTEHEIYTNDIGEYSTLNLWPLICDYGLADELVYDAEGLEKLGYKNTPTINFNDITSDPELIDHLKWCQIKTIRLIEITEAIHLQIKHITRELNKAIEAA
ncbi:MAG: hypothetical protein ABJH98_06710 [Reichenbachiella sp.]|uniref:hypothetical protein n=1 Tax=Reichenbachiella sp. TaxID=2184521 RepID=UPI003296E6F9